MLEGIVRDSITKQGSKTLRRDGYLIANIYGKGLENINAAFKKNEFARTVKTKDSLAFDVKVEGKEWTAKSECLIEEGAKVEILSIDGVKLVVKEKKEK